MPLRFDPWFLAIRPKTLPASIAPVLLGSAMAFGDGIGHWPSALLALLGAVLIQIGTNLANDYFDSRNGVDTVERKGPLRVTQSGLIPASAVRVAFISAFALAGVAGLFLVLRAGWPVVIIGVLSILSGIFYAAGPRPLSHLGLGELFVLIFFGPVAVAGTYYVQSFEINGAVVLAGLACGFFSTAVLCVNNLRDITTDRRAGKRTLAVRFGDRFARGEYLFCLLAACACPPLVFAVTDQHPWTMAASLVIFACLPLVETVYRGDRPEALNDVLARTGKMLLWFTLIYSITWII
ncbi:MAG: 1,4-dihydroxy-2-naphthoate polyprenyltransferase [Candidatus Omnitrophica bacterium]|nr:1,4-dihydroxy-2-naphthoate polyprenyltransferase [Candidatus Omnitrophota bacterium]